MCMSEKILTFSNMINFSKGLLSIIMSSWKYFILKFKNIKSRYKHYIHIKPLVYSKRFHVLHVGFIGPAVMPNSDHLYSQWMRCTYLSMNE